MGAIVRFVVIAVAGAAGVAAIEKSPLAGFIFFVFSLAAVVSLLDTLGIVSLEDWTGILAYTLGFLATVVSLLIDAVVG
ncbi:hypothetical protein [Litoreibacter ascidiaceicola]|uniref:hypothetical protein n=1 Tax=Litoreibacter ascidiaceicola TaxID=1486859 RepID=UPI00093226B9|nr:hypothetical protein [Litoreibacter ascidiaceicola]